MNIAANARLLALLSAAHALGTLRGGARRRFEALAREQPAVRASALLWRERLTGFVELAPAVNPPAAVWTRIRNLVDADLQETRLAQQKAAPTPPVRTTGWWGSLAIWRGASAAGLAATVLAGVIGLQFWYQAREAQQVKYVAVLNDDRSAASMLVTFDAKHRQLTLQRVGDFSVAADRSLQLWALPPGRTPQSLGVVDSPAGMRLAASAQMLQQAPALAVSLEPKGGVSGDRGPTGPVLFHGALIEKTL
ncbi:anti-sigma factor domain-containing protein [Pseudacidovorax sp. RU35E]|uniref:anti-sigma factor n=1 Tax=Pseudacidovorax sp. RU35E TaxID=1907403 RepID=UPI0009549C4B|nr:anti-sigma factor [Pseudacidovorax sp. RU35E]SIR67681.1 Anti-sigma-K factor RskA [Pseudacidovorax sp. RU35E]